MIDMTESIAPKSDQANADDFMTGPRTFTIADVRKGASTEQPIDVYLAEFPQSRPFKPSKSMRRIMVAAWGRDAATYVGKRMTLFRDPAVRFGGQDIGGIRISHMSDLPGHEPLRVALTVTRGKRSPYVVEPLPDGAVPSPAVSPKTLAKLTATLKRKGILEDKWLAGVNHYTKGAATALEVITEDQAQQMLAELNRRPDTSSIAADPCPICGSDEGQPHDGPLHEAAGA